MSPTYHVYVSDRGNIFMTEIAALVAAALADTGRRTVFPAPGLPEAGPDRINIVVAPHEFYPLQRGIPDRDLLAAAETAVSVGVEQPGTHWFDLGARYSSVGPFALDISRFAAEELTRRGIEARHLQLGYHKSWDMWGGDPERPRPTDVLFLGSVTARRDAILGMAAPFLWDWNADLRLFEFPRPMSQPRGHFVASRDKWELLASSRILLNVHRNDVPYFEWVRTLDAVVNGCLVLTEPSDEYGPLEVGKHFLAVPGDCIGPYAASLLADETLRREITVAAYEMVRSELDMTALLAPVCAELEAVAVRPSRARKPLTFSTAPAGPAPAPAANPVVEQALATETRVRARVKDLLDSETALVRRVEGLQARMAYGDAEHVSVTTTPGWKSFEAKVSVLVTSYNSEAFLADALGSVIDSPGVDAELVVVDDHSSDGSVEVVRQLMDAHPYFPVSLLARAANGGVSVARNSGLEAVRGDYVFILDSDNRIYPNALRRLTAALDAAPDAAFSYGIIVKTGEGGLLSYLPWDLERLCETNYIDAMALIRRSVFTELGGYDRHFGLRGWEDYELWLRVAAAGYRAEFVASLIGTYAVRPGSRQETVNLDSPTLFRELKERYAFLPWS